MANPEHLKILEQGVEVWNQWREENPEVIPDLSNTEISRKKFEGIDLNRSNCSGTDFSRTVFVEASLFVTNLCGCKFVHSDFSNAHLFHAALDNCDFTNTRFYKADLSNATFIASSFLRTTLIGANLVSANFFKCKILRSDFEGAILNNTNFEKAEIYECNFEKTTLVEANFNSATFSDNRIFGISSWKLQKDGFIQSNLRVTPIDELRITVDDLEVAQFIYLMLNNQNIRNVIETITSKAVLILGRFTEERKKVLDALKDELRKRNYLPIVFDFENPSGKSVDETINLLARMSRFVIADITDAKSIPQELRGIVPDNPSIPVVPLIWKDQREYGMFDYFRGFSWVLPLHEYESPEALLRDIISAIIAPAEQKVKELREKTA